VRSKGALASSQLERRSGSYPVVRFLQASPRSKRSYVLEALPNEVLSLVFSFLDVRSLFMYVINQKFREIREEEVIAHHHLPRVDLHELFGAH
jgi:hypothetical protein